MTATIEKAPAKAPEKPAPPKKPEYYMPPVVPGQRVRWASCPGAPFDHVAMVFAVNNRCVDMHVFASGASSFMWRSGVRHASDPEQHTMRSDDGLWDYLEGEGADLHTVVQQLKGRVSVLEDRIEMLLQELGAKTAPS